MKHLTDYIKESLEIDLRQVNESSNNKWFRIDISDFPDAYDSLKSIADHNKLYNEPIDNGIKIEVKDGQAEQLTGVIELLTELVNSKQEDEKMKDACDKLIEVIDAMNDYMEDKAEEAEEKDKEEAEEKAKEEAEQKSKEEAEEKAKEEAEEKAKKEAEEKDKEEGE